ncbi:protein eva-1 homolog C isoform X2 [Heterocephalus glaber]|uniref:Protein eva-1 homolog C n=1 Tax=Heterocephalus glaber TaxID=10181 RepID=A0AAX6STK1_HETGA|nr:protein eva-1 homolog C isoform X2 [Heterocephalus glaber]
MLLPGHARPPSASQPAQHPGLRRQVDLPGQLLRLFYCTVLVCSKEIAALTDFSGYLTKLLQNHTAYACDGDHLNLQCPRHSTISVQSAFYGQDYQMCSSHQPESQREDSLNCVASTTLQKVLDECQNQRACHLLVNSRVFGPDLCPGSSKYLLVSFKCQPKLKNKTVCEDQELKLHCHESKFLNIYSATYGRRMQERDVCSSEAERLPPFDCLSYSALQVLSRRCYGKQRCKILVNNYHFGSPCLPRVKKYLTVTYACVPKNILAAIDPAIANLKPTLKQEDGEHGINFDPSESRVLQKDGVIVSNSLAAFAYIRAHPERAALLFVSSVCIGLALTLCALVIRVSCTKDFRELQLGREHLVPGSDKAEEDSEDDGQEEDSSDSEFPGELPGLRRTSYPAYSSIEAAELAERIERREQIIQEIWMNSGLDTSPPRNMGQFY